jgi:Ca-activated chloride channel homolog
LRIVDQVPLWSRHKFHFSKPRNYGALGLFLKTGEAVVARLEPTIPMQKLLLSLILLFLGLQTGAFAQTQKVQGQISSKTAAELTILSIVPDSFPTISAVFRAETSKGEPVWNLTKEKMRVMENDEACEVISLRPIAQEKPIVMAVVIDHSGSMDPTAYFDFMTGNYTTSKGSALDDAKKSAISFFKKFDFAKDYMSVIGFSSEVSQVLPASHDLRAMTKMVDKMQPDGGTALYDGIAKALEEVKKQDGLPVVVALTDGQDNASIHANASSIIDDAKKAEIPIYMIGLGDVDERSMKNIAQSTGGNYYHTKSSKKLAEVYAQISRSVQAYYELVYRSPHLENATDIADVAIYFDVDSVDLTSHSRRYVTPQAVLDLVAERKVQAEQGQQRNLIIGGTAAGLVLLSAGIVFLYFKRKKPQPTPTGPKIAQLYPNPSHGLVTVVHDATIGEISITGLDGTLLRTTDVTEPQQLLDLTGLPNGTYLVSIVQGGLISNVMKVVIQK